jgi:hypothetical protein
MADIAICGVVESDARVSAQQRTCKPQAMRCPAQQTQWPRLARQAAPDWGRYGRCWCLVADARGSSYDWEGISFAMAITGRIVILPHQTSH